MRNFIYIISEFNPPHLGHHYLLSEAKRIFPDSTVVSVMSGHFTERGSPAITDKFTRARAALASGANLVLSLPFPYSSASAENFARGGVYIADCFARALNGDGHYLMFGSESGDLDRLRLASERMSSEEYRQRLYSVAGGHNARDMKSLYSRLYGSGDAELLNGSNDLLGIEYISAIMRAGSPLIPYAVSRTGASHDSEHPDGAFASGSYIRRLIAAGDFEAAGRYMQENARNIVFDSIKRRGFADEGRCGAYMMSILRMTNPNEADHFAECSGGLGRKLIASSLRAVSYDDMICLAGSKKYTNARLRRAALFASVGVKRGAFSLPPAYTQLLAADVHGRLLLREYKKHEGKLTVVTKMADALSAEGRLGEASAVELRADRLYTLAFDHVLPSDYFVRMHPIFDEHGTDK